MHSNDQISMSDHREAQVSFTENKASFSAAGSEESGGLEALHKTQNWNFIFNLSKSLLEFINGEKCLFVSKKLP